MPERAEQRRIPQRSARSPRPGLAGQSDRWRSARHGVAALWVAVVVAAGVGLGLAARPPAAPPSLDARAAALARQVRCPVCVDISAEDSDAPAAKAVRVEIRDLLAAGETPSEVKAVLVAHYGPSILLVPPTSSGGSLLWVLPIAAVVAAVGGLGTFGLRRRRRRAPEQGASEEDRRTVDEALSEGAGG